MKKYISTLFILLLVSLCSYSQSGARLRLIHPQIETPDYTIATEPNTQVWATGALRVPTDYTSGFRVELTFTSSTQSMGEVLLLRLGGKYVQNSTNIFRYGYSIIDANTLLRTKRQISLDGNAKTCTYDTWDNTFIEPGENYKLIFEIDETRLRVQLQKGGNPLETKTEYEFNGLSNSYLRDVLDGTSGSGFESIVLCTDKRLMIREIEIWSSDSGVEVKNPVTSPPFTAYLKNINSELFLQPYNGDTPKGTKLVQNDGTSSIWSLWEISPLYSDKRLTTSYPVKLRNVQSNRYAVVKDASTVKGTPIIQWTDDYNNNSIWEVLTSDHAKFNLKNKATSGYAVVKDASKENNADVIQWDSGNTDNALWKIHNARWDAPVEDGYYLIKNVSSNLLMGLEPTFAPYVRFVKFDQNNGGCGIYWYIKKHSSGAYSITNVLQNQPLVTAWHKTKPYPYVYLANPGEAGYMGTYLWYFKPSTSGGYTIHQCHMEEILGAPNDQASASVDVVLRPETTTQCTSWELEKFSFHMSSLKGGFYKIKFASNNKYLVVKNASTEAGGQVVSYSSADTKNAWWYIEEIGSDGGYRFRNVNSSLALTIQPTSAGFGGYAVQDVVYEGTNDPTQLRQLEHISDNKYYMYNFYRLGSLALPDTDLQQAYIGIGAPRGVWIFEAVNP